MFGGLCSPAEELRTFCTLQFPGFPHPLVGFHFRCELFYTCWSLLNEDLCLR